MTKTNAFGMVVPDDWEPGTDLTRLRAFDRNVFRHSHALTDRVVEPVPPCWFCDTDMRGKSAEHVFPQWLLRDYGAANELTRPTRRDHLTPWMLSDRGPIPLRSLKVNVCAACNNGWMSQLEAAAKPLLTGPRAGELNPDDVETLARWFTKTATVLNVSMPYRLLVDRAARHSLAAGGMPTDLYVALHRVSRQDGVVDWAQGHSQALFPADEAASARPDGLARSFTCHVRVLDLVGVVTTSPPRREATLHVGHGLPCIWPLAGEPLPWAAVPVLEDYLSAPVTWVVSAD